MHIEPVPVQQLVANGFAEAGVADHDRDDMARRWHHRKAGVGEAPFQTCRAFLVAVAFDLALLQMAYRGERTGGDRGRQ